MKLSLISLGKGTDGKVRSNTTFSTNINNCWQLCHSEDYTSSACLKLVDIRPKCAKCEGGHKNDNYGLKCSFYFGVGCMEDRCWKKFAKGLLTMTNFLEVLNDDEEVTLA